MVTVKKNKNWKEKKNSALRGTAKNESSSREINSYWSKTKRSVALCGTSTLHQKEVRNGE